MSERGQLVLLSAALIAVALLGLLTAVTQLGYQPDGPDHAVDPHPVTSSTQVLDRAVADVAPVVPGTFGWTERERAVVLVRSRLAEPRAALNRSRLAAGTSLAVRFNQSRASAWAGRHCPGGPGRDFGGCWASDGVVLQNRRGRAHLVAVAADVRATGPRTHWQATVVVRPRS
jgi:hypothetical protein